LTEGITLCIDSLVQAGRQAGGQAGWQAGGQAGSVRHQVLTELCLALTTTSINFENLEEE